MTFMHWVEEFGLDLAQPALTADSDVSWLHLVHKPGLDVERTLFVEIQFFAVSKRLFDLALPYFRQGYSGFGMDVVLARLGSRYGLTAAVIHSVQMRHPSRPKSKTVHANPELHATNDRLIEDIYRQLGRYPTLDQFQCISDKLRKLTPALLLATAPFYIFRFLLLQLLRMLGLRRHYPH